MNQYIVFVSIFAVGASSAWPQAQITAVVNAASFQSGLPSGGAIATMFCTGLPLSRVEAGTYVASTSLPLPMCSAGCRLSLTTPPLRCLL
jgi:hypothetical protein